MIDIINKFIKKAEINGQSLLTNNNNNIDNDNILDINNIEARQNIIKDSNILVYLC